MWFAPLSRVLPETLAIMVVPITCSLRTFERGLHSRATLSQPFLHTLRTRRDRFPHLSDYGLASPTNGRRSSVLLKLMLVLLPVACGGDGGDPDAAAVSEESTLDSRRLAVDSIVGTDSDARMSFDLSERLSIGSLDGPDAFGRIMDAKIHAGRIYVADDLRHHVAVYDTAGDQVDIIGGQGEGPGEFSSPWKLVLGKADSLFVWDTEQAKISVFSPAPDFNYTRAFQVPPHWLISDMTFGSDNARLWVAAYGAGEEFFLHQLTREGRIVEQMIRAPASSEELAGFQGSLLGGTFAMMESGSVVFSARSPYQLHWLDEAGTVTKQCHGQSGWTTDPSDVVRQDSRGAGLDWGGYVHSAKILSLGDGILMNQILDPVADRRILDLIDTECRIVRRKVTDTPVLFADTTPDGSILIGVRSLTFPEIVIYDVTRDGLGGAPDG